MKDVEIIKARNVLSSRTRANLAKRLRVAAYCRVSTDSEDQLNSYKSQVQHYTDLIKSKSEWDLAGIYADEAITGTQVTKREDFQRLINDCMNGDVDMIITKSISRFARNTLDTLKYVRMLKEKGIAVKVGKFIMSANGKSPITKEERGFIKVVAEEESGVIVGEQMMCARATDMIGEFVTAVANNMTVSQLLKGMRAHPTYNEGIGEALEELEGGAIHVMPKKKIIFYNFEEEEHIWEVFLIF